jgi:NitT/TauT family transport system ATP-binding protein
LLGPSGCGKTTLIRIIAGLLMPDRGEVLVNNQPVTAPGRDRCMVFQQFGLLPWRTVMSNVEFGLEIEGVGREERRQLADKYLELVGLQGFENYYPHQISGGMQQRVGIARALAKKPEFLLMDEPFGAVDAQTREQLQEELLKIWAQTEATVVFVTHSIDEAIYLSDRVVVMQARPGRIKEEVAIDLRRPRWEGDVKADPRFAQLRSRLRESLRE